MTNSRPSTISTVELVADEERKMIEAYGVWVEKSLYGRRYMGVERATFLIGARRPHRRHLAQGRVKGHAEAVLEAVLRALNGLAEPVSGLDLPLRDSLTTAYPSCVQAAQQVRHAKLC